jgi:predicted nucleic acid-binding Zn ribbon protein
VNATSPAAEDALAGSSPQEMCPLCGAPLKPEQDWCLRCGAAARTRLAAQPKWRALVVALVVVVVLSLGVLAAALVKLAG